MRDEETTYREGVKESLTEILQQTRLTNGRVRALEKWRWFIMGGLAILSVLVVPILLELVNKHL